MRGNLGAPSALPLSKKACGEVIRLVTWSAPSLAQAPSQNICKLMCMVQKEPPFWWLHGSLVPLSVSVDSDGVGGFEDPGVLRVAATLAYSEANSYGNGWSWV